MTDDRPAPRRVAGRMTRPLFLAAGLVFVALGIVGAVLPLMPSTIFFILAAGCFARSSTRLEGWLMQHRRFGPVLRAWREEHAIPRRAKWLACAGMALGLILFVAGAHPAPWLFALVALLLIGCAAFVVSRPEPRG